MTMSAAGILFFGCSKLDEKFKDSLPSTSSGNIKVEDLLNTLYRSDMRMFQGQGGFWAMQEHSSDEAVGPTRGGDWDDNGVWRVIHAHKWDANHAEMYNAYRGLGKIVYDATELLAFSPTPQQAAEARFMRAFANFYWVEGWNQVPYREQGGDPLAVPKVRVGAEALDYVIKELEEIKSALPDGGGENVVKANKDACRVLLMKAYLTKGVIANRAAPTFDAGDMAKVIALADEIPAAKYALTTNYFSNFAPTNNVLSTENIFTGENIGGSSSGGVRNLYFCSLHYNNNPSGWNGFTTLSEFYDKFDATDKRRSASYTGVTDRTGLKVGLLEGQQFNQAGVALKDRNGNPLAFTKQVALKETDKNTLEVTGVRVVKYPPDYDNGDNVNNDYVFFRYADVLLMKAEALLRSGGSATTALGLVNAVRARAGVADLVSVNLDQLLDERGREFYWEGQRRQDLIRFGKFLAPNSLKPETSDAHYLLFPTPAPQLAANPNLVQNPGY